MFFYRYTLSFSINKHYKSYKFRLYNFCIFYFGINDDNYGLVSLGKCNTM